MKKIIVTTTINPPTAAIKAFDAMKDWELIVIGDLKTPADYKLERGRYVSPAEQEALLPDLSKAIGFGCIQRRNIGFVMAHQAGADIVATIDDDNIPLPGWGENLLIDRPVYANQWHSEIECFDPLHAAGHGHLWHRGFPLQLLAKRVISHSFVGTSELAADIQADFWHGDPDVDAICRMEHAPECRFHNNPFPFSGDKISPFNSQNTFLLRKVLPHYFMMCGVGRMDDIWASFHAQAQGFKVVYGQASVVQNRNDHDLTVDMEKEYIGYSKNLKIIQQLAANKNAVLDHLPLHGRGVFEVYQSYFS